MSKQKYMNKTKIKIVKNTKIENMNYKKIWIIKNMNNTKKIKIYF